MKHPFHKALALALALALLLPAVAGAELSPHGQFPISPEKKTITVGIGQNLSVTNYEENAFTQWIEEMGNVELAFEMFPSSGNESLQKLEIMINSGAEMPDTLIGFSLDESAILNYGSQGIFLALNAYIDTVGLNVQEAFERVTDKGLRAAITSADGNIYYLPKFNEQLGNMYPLRSWINKAWLDKLGLEIPTTTEEFYAVLKAFQEGDPNGNGVADEVGFAGTPRGWYQQNYNWLMNAFLYNDNRDYWLLEDGKLDVPYNKEAWREGLRFMHKLCSENLMTSLSFTMDEAQLMQLLAAGDGVSTVGVFTAGAFNRMPNDERRLEYVTLPPLTGPEGVGYSTYVPVTPLSMFIITKDASDPELTFRLGDLMITEEGAIRNRWGVPGVDWREPREGEHSMLEYLGYPARIVPILAWGSPQASHWQYQCCGVLQAGVADGQVSISDDPLDGEIWVSDAVGKYIDKNAPTVAAIKYTLEENDEIKEIKSLLKTYVDECVARFVTGDLDVEKDWDSYLKELDNIGLPYYLEIAQRAYDRMNDQ